jgi:hypothetical protein
MHRKQAIALSMAKGVFGVTLVTGFAVSYPAPVWASPVSDDDPSFDCVSQGNRVCGPGNEQGVTPGCYDDGGVMFKPWPCEAWKLSDGYRHGDGSITDSSGEYLLGYFI